MDDENEGTKDLGPGAAYSIFISMQDTLEKLKLLRYDKDFLKKSSAYKSISKTYFAQQTNPGEQFYMFTNLAVWLIQKAGNNGIKMPEEHDDPNATISGILNEMRKMDISVDFSPNRLKSGYGEQCIFVLNSLADVALKNNNFQWKRPIFPKAEQPVDEELVTLEQDKDLSEVDEEEISTDEYEDSEDEAENGFLALEGFKSTPLNVRQNNEERAILKSDVDVNEWNMEVDRVTPSLKIIVRQDLKDWRNHLEQISAYKTNLNDTFKQMQPNLERLTGEISKNLEKLDSRERYLNTQLESMLSQFRLSKDKLAEVKQRYQEASSGLTERSKILAQITDDLEQTKRELEERSLNLTDNAPLLKVKQALARLQQEIFAVDIAIGAIDQTLLQYQMREKNNMQATLLDDFLF